MLTQPGRPRVLSVSAHRRVELADGWRLCSTNPNAAADPAALDALQPSWESAVVPGTVAEAMRRAGKFDIDNVPNFDERDWWYRCEFDAKPDETAGSRVLCCDGLATLAEVWLNGTLVLASDDMFIAHEVDVSLTLRARNELTIRFRSLTTALASRRPRPAWRTKLVEHQQLRWMRTTLLGRMPGWSPPVRAVGPWRPVTLESRGCIAVESGDIRPALDAGGGRVDSALVVRPLGGTHVLRAALSVGNHHGDLRVERDGDRVVLRGTLRIPDAQLWWPHTHGRQPRYDARIVVTTSSGDLTIELGRVAFRHIAVATADGGFTVVVNGKRVFCRGACWTTPDVVRLGTDDAAYEKVLTAVRDAGMNMIRVGGTMVYEANAFYEWCDRLGILVWQDFMFASMDYPADDATFRELVEREVVGELARLRRYASLAVLCGNSEIEQQAAMVGVPEDRWGSALFRRLLPDRCAEAAPDVPYIPGSPTGGALPFHAEAGATHYYGVGAYLRPLDDARRANVRFAAECLGFSNIPSQAAVDALLPSGESPVHHPRWKARVPRDHGAGWDFEDVRDHYLEQLYGVHPMRLRYSDMDRYLALSRVVPGEVMSRTLGEWRRRGSSCSGALVWFLQDLWPGAGWGVLDASGNPKATYYALKRAMQPVAIAMTDEGTNGIHVHVVNDHATELDADVQIALYRNGQTCIGSGSAQIVVPSRDAVCLSADALLGRFHDVAYAYRFGAPGHDLVVATVRDATGARIADAFHFPAGLPSNQHESVGLRADVERRTDGSVAVTLRAEQFAQSVAIDARGACADDDYFHVAPGGERTIVFGADAAASLSELFIQPLNARTGVRVAVPSAGGAPG